MRCDCCMWYYPKSCHSPEDWCVTGVEINNDDDFDKMNHDCMYYEEEEEDE